MIDYPDRVDLAHTPTPLQPLDALSSKLGVELLVKRDDLTGAELTGNKVRKLEFLLADALAAGADTLITCGGEQSNHCRATALAALRYGLRTVLLLRTRVPQNPPPATGNILLDRLAGAEVLWLSHAEYGRRASIFEHEAERLRGYGKVPYIIPEGGSNAVGAWGYVRAAAELAEQLAALPDKPTTIVYAAGSGGTGAGLVVGLRMTGMAEHGVRATGINVCDDRDTFVATIGRICADMHARWPDRVPATEPRDIDILDGYVGDGYAQSRDVELELIRDVARATGLVLDPVYTGKAFYGLTCELARDRARFGERVVFLHTGGIFGLLAQPAAIAPLLG